MNAAARLAQSAERKALNLVVVGSSPTVGVSLPARLLRIAKSATNFAVRSVRRLVLPSQLFGLRAHDAARIAEDCHNNQDLKHRQTASAHAPQRSFAGHTAVVAHPMRASLTNAHPGVTKRGLPTRRRRARGF